MFCFASSCIYGMVLVKVVLLFQNTEMRNDLSQLLLRHLNIFKYLALQSEFFTEFLFNSLQPGEGHVQREMQVPFICHFSGFVKYVVVGFFPPSFGLWTQKQWKPWWSCDMKLSFIISSGNSICNGIKPKLLLRFFFLITLLKSGKIINLLLFFSSIPLCHYLSVFLHNYHNSCWNLYISYIWLQRSFLETFLSLPCIKLYEEDATVTSIQLSSYRKIEDKVANKTGNSLKKCL